MKIHYSLGWIGWAAVIPLAACNLVLPGDLLGDPQNQDDDDDDDDDDGSDGGDEADSASPEGSTTAAESGDDGASDDGPVADCGLDSLRPRSLRLLTRAEYQSTLMDLLGVEAFDLSVLPIEPQVLGFRNNADASVVSSRHIDAYMDLSARIVGQAFELDAATLIGCMPEDAACPRSFVERIGERAFRRPLEPAEIEGYLGFFEGDLSGGDFYVGAQTALRAILMSPNFLYRSEVGADAGDGTYRLTSYEIATWLAYTFWGTMPDAALFDAAAMGRLDAAEGIEAEAVRLLDDPRGRRHVGRFAGQWFGTDALLELSKDAMLFPQFTDDVRESMLDEVQAFFEYVVYDAERPFEALLLSDRAFVNDTLAAYYGLPAPGSAEVVSVSVPPDQRGGILRTGAVMAAHAHAMESAPVLRGVFVRKRLMCQELPPPPPDIDTTPPGLDPTLTTRERFSRHSNDPVCETCHRLIDPIGFSFEGYDGAGGYRSTDNGQPVDASGRMIGLESLSDGFDQPFNGPQELSAILAASPNAQHCAVRQYFRFSSGARELAADECTIDRLAERFSASGGDFYQLFIDVTQLPSFALRRE